jgi:uncharacterized membrane protein affecting hemolysin expression
MELFVILLALGAIILAGISLTLLLIERKRNKQQLQPLIGVVLPRDE